MKIFDSMAFRFLKMACPMLAAISLSACSEEKAEPLPDLPPIELPKDVPGLYSGNLPCDDCTIRMIRMELKADSTAEVVQTKVRDAMQVDTLMGVYVVTDSALKVTLPMSQGSADSIHWGYKRSKSGNLTYLNSTGSIYEDGDGNRFELIRIFKALTFKKPVSDSLEQSNQE